eukprot:TRINITY_DN33121_c0_g1_i1.p2 TRINITY_DN33121_c0_g1~~TRINITY_DN33121_c0_g1_i1.p2  ORF type:complete len:254 (+),score=78.64 TRINITY_DN33121_c0_g1_i1:52-762(+)
MAEAERLLDGDKAKDVYDPLAGFPMSMLSQTQHQFVSPTSELYRGLLVQWRNESGAEELLQWWEGADRCKDILQSVEDETLDNDDLDCSLPWAVDVLFKCERDRFRFMLSEYLRIRLLKIEAYVAWLLADPDRKALMSPAELNFCVRYKALQDQATADTIDVSLQGLPQPLIDHDTRAAQPYPSTSHHVFVMFMKAVGGLQIHPSMDPQDIAAGDLYLLRYGVVRQLIADGDAVIV